MKDMDNIKATELTEEEIDKAVGGAIIYKRGRYELVYGEDIIGKYASYEEALYMAQYYGYSTRYFSSESAYLDAFYPREIKHYEINKLGGNGIATEVTDYHPATIQGW